MFNAFKSLALATVATSLLISAPAHAQSSECWTNAFPFFSLSCETADIPANGSGHFIYMQVYSGNTTYRLREYGSNILIREGTTGGGWHYEHIFGLYARYYIYCNGAFSDCKVSNT